MPYIIFNNHHDQLNIMTNMVINIMMMLIIGMMLMIIMYVCSIDWLVLSTKQKLVHLPKCLNNANNLNRTFLQYHHHHHHHHSSILEFKQNSLISGKSTSPKTQNFACVYFHQKGSTRTRCSWWKWWGWWLKVMTRKWWRSQSQGSSRLSKVPPTHPLSTTCTSSRVSQEKRKSGTIALLFYTVWVHLQCSHFVVNSLSFH